MPPYKLIYFNVRGFAEMSRMIFEYAKQPYEDVRVDHAEWSKIKPNFPFGQLPVLEVDGKQLAQSCAIARYLARKFNLAGKDDFESAQVDMIADTQKDISAKLQPYFSVAAGHAEGDKDALKASVLIPTLDQYMSVFERFLKESGSGFFVKSGVTWADFFVSQSLVTLTNLVPDVMEKYKWVSEYIKRVHSLPQIKDYIEKRPVSTV